MRDVAALFWLQSLYGDATMELPGYNMADVNDIIAYATNANKGLNDQVVITRSPSATLPPVPPPSPTSSCPPTILSGFWQFLLRFVRFFLPFL